MPTAPDDSLWKSIGPRIHGYARKLLMPLGVEFYLRKHDRKVLETEILPYFQRRDDIRSVLFVGCAWYTRGYRRFFRDKTYWTLDMDPQQRQFGAKLHVTDSLANAANYFEPGQLDLIICNGVYGWGLNELEEFDRAIHACYLCLRDEGIFLLGWDDNPARRPFPLASSRSLAMLERFRFPPLGTDHYLTENPGRHTFDFYVKRAAAPPAKRDADAAE